MKKRAQSLQQIYLNICKKNKDFIHLVVKHIQEICRQLICISEVEEVIYQTIKYDL